MKIKHRLFQLHIAFSLFFKRLICPEEEKLLTGRMLANQIKLLTTVESLHDVEFKVFSQWGDDGIIQWLINNIVLENKYFIEFGVEDYRESNTRFLMINNNWSGLILDGSKKNIAKVIDSEYYWRHELQAHCYFVTKDNIMQIIEKYDLNKKCSLLHIDIDGNDYWVWESVDITPEIVIIEYNSVFGANRTITTPYSNNFNRANSHYSHLYFGASLNALVTLSEKKGYAFIGCNSAGNNAYFVRRDKLNNIIKEISVEEGYVKSKFRESRAIDGSLNYLSGLNRLNLIKGMPVYNIITEQIEDL